MANPTFKRIKDLSLEKTSVADNDWFVLEDSADSFKTKKVKGQYIGANIYKNNGTLTGNRTVTGATYNLTFNTLGDLKFNSKTTGYLMGYYDLGNGRPEFVLDGANGNQTWARFRNNGTDIRNTFSVGTSIWEQYREWQVRSIVTNNIHMIRDIDGRWLFANDATGLDTPDSDTRVKIASDGLSHALRTDARIKMENLPTYADNATAVSALGTGELYYRTGHGLDITV